MADISQIKIDDMNNGEPYNIKDAEARRLIDELTSRVEELENNIPVSPPPDPEESPDPQEPDPPLEEQ